jgi:hypothetical protein
MVDVGRIRVWETRLISDKIRKVGDLLRGRKGNQWSFVCRQHRNIWSGRYLYILSSIVHLKFIHQLFIPETCLYKLGPISTPHNTQHPPELRYLSSWVFHQKYILGKRMTNCTYETTETILLPTTSSSINTASRSNPGRNMPKNVALMLLNQNRKLNQGGFPSVPG